MIRTVWLNGQAVGTVQRLGYESGMQGQYSYSVAGVVEFIVVVSLDVRGEYLPRNTDLISELIAQFNGVL